MAIDENNLAENTIVIYVSDQGLYFGKPRGFDKRWIYEESWWFPFVM